MRNGKTTLALTALATMVLTASLALAGPGGAGRGSGAGVGGPCGGQGYGPGVAQLSPEKQAAFQKLHEAFYTKTVQMRATLRIKWAELNAAAVAPTPDQGKIDALSKEIGDLEGKLLAERTQFRVQVTKEIGPEAAACLGGYGHGRGSGHGGYGHGGGMGGGMMGGF